MDGHHVCAVPWSSVLPSSTSSEGYEAMTKASNS